MKPFALLVVCVLLPLVAGHGWVTNPQPRGYTGSDTGASQSSPCGAGAGNSYPQTITLTSGDYLNVSWTIGGGHTGANPDVCRFAWALTDDSATNFDASGHTLVNNIDCATSGGHSQYFPVSLNTITDPTTAYLQFRWSAGDGSTWYNCIKLFVSPSGVVVNDETEGVTFSDTISPSELNYYRVDIEADKHIYVTITATGNNLFALSGESLPNSVNNSQSWSNGTIGQQFGLSACSLEETDTTFYLAAFGGSSDISFTATAESYDALLFPVYEAPQIQDSLPFGGSKFYWTEAYQAETPKRVYAEKTSGSGWIRIWKSLSCTLNNMDVDDEAENDWGSRGACIDLGYTEGRKYIQVESVNGTSIEFDLGVEDGLCADKDFNAASTAQISFMVLIAALLAIL
jgi:hypothetical protein